jgi:hypothetical protein
MVRQTVITKKRRGPAPTGKGTLVGVCLQPAQLEALDAWIAKQKPLDKTTDKLFPEVRRGLLICRNATPSGRLDQFDCGDQFDLIPAAVGAYSENGPDGAAINPRRVRLIARRR